MADPWQEFDCPTCGVDFDIEPPVARGTLIECIHCHTWFTADEDLCNTYTGMNDAWGSPICSNMPEPSI